MNPVELSRLLTRPAEFRPMVFVVHSDSATRMTLDALIRDANWEPQLFADAQTLLAQLHWNGPACVILDTRLPDADGLELQSLLAERSDLPVIFVADNPSARTIVRAMKAGAVELLTRPFDEHLLLEAIRHALQLSASRRTRKAERCAVLEKYERLSRREREVMRHVVRGELNKNIAADLGISEITVKVHRGQVMRKMQAGSLPDLVNMAAILRSQLADPPREAEGLPRSLWTCAASSSSRMSSGDFAAR